MNIEFKAEITYDKLREIIFNYFKKNLNLEVSSISNDYLLQKLAGFNEVQPFFIIHNEFGDTRFDLSKEQMEQFLREYLAHQNYELSGVEYRTKDISITYKECPNLSQTYNEKINLDMTLNSTIDFNQLRDIIVEYLKKTRGIEVSTISIDYLRKKLAGFESTQPFFIIRNEIGESRFDIPKEEIIAILREYLASFNYKLEEVQFGYRVDLKYKLEIKSKEEKEVVKESNDLDTDTIEEDKVLQNEEPSPTPSNTEEDSLPEFDSIPVVDEELEQMAREHRTFTILQRERAMSDAQKAKNRSAIMAGLCILGAAIAIYFNGQDPNQVIQHELGAIYSWEALGQYLQDLGPLTTLLSAGAGGFVYRYFKNSKKFKQKQNEMIDFSRSLENTDPEEFGGIGNAKSK